MPGAAGSARRRHGWARRSAPPPTVLAWAHPPPDPFSPTSPARGEAPRPGLRTFSADSSGEEWHGVHPGSFHGRLPEVRVVPGVGGPPEAVRGRVRHVPRPARRADPAAVHNADVR